MDNSGADVLITTEKFAQKAHEVVHGSGIQLVVQSELQPSAVLSTNTDLETDTDQGTDGGAAGGGGMMLYTSGTTSRPVCLCLRCLHNTYC